MAESREAADYGSVSSPACRPWVDLLELLHGASERWTTVAATARTWRQNDVAERARERWDAELSAAGHGGNRTSVLAGVGGASRRLGPLDAVLDDEAGPPATGGRARRRGRREGRPGASSPARSDGFMPNEGDARRWRWAIRSSLSASI